MPSRSLLYKKVVQSERIGNKKRKSFKLPFPNCSRLHVKAEKYPCLNPISQQKCNIKVNKIERNINSSLNFTTFAQNSNECAEV